MLYPLTKQELDQMYGQRTVAVNLSFSCGNSLTGITHYYLQRENDVLHIGDDIINSLHVGYLNKHIGEMEPMPLNDFKLKAKELIYNMELDTFWKK